MIRRRTASMVLIVGLLLAATMPGQAQEQELCFEETPYCISGRLLEFWLANGALDVFGYPIGPQQEEMIEDQPIQVQRFQRNRLELHPDQERPYDVQLGRLGVDRLEQLGMNWYEFPTAEGPQADCVFFAETSQNVCGEILTSWQVEGIDLNEDGISGNSDAESLALFGLPLSGLMTQTLGDGQEYTVQYFERARFELHPQNDPPYNVQLGLLGLEILEAEQEGQTDEQLEATPQPEPTPTDSPGAEAPPTADNPLCSTPVSPQDAAETPLRIVRIDKVEEFVRLENVGAEVVTLDDWTMCSVRGNEEHTGLAGPLEPGATADFFHQGTAPVWSNSDPDDGMLFDGAGNLISYWSDEAD